MRLVWHTNVISPNLLTKIAHFAKQFRPNCFSISPNLFRYVIEKAGQNIQNCPALPMISESH